MSAILLSITEAIKYVTAAPYFWGSMGLTTAVGMFVGAYIYNGECIRAYKGAMVLFGYAGLSIFFNLLRVGNRIFTQTHRGFFAASVTLSFVFLFYFFGLILGVKLVENGVKRR